MVREVLSLRAEAQVSGFRQLEGLVHAQVQSDESRPVENVPAECAKAHKAWARTWVRRIAEKGIWSCLCERGIAIVDIIRNATARRHPRFPPPNSIVAFN